MNFRAILLFLFLLIIISTISAQNYVSTYSGNGIAGINNGAVNSSTFNSPFGMCMDKYANIYIADGGNNCIRKINTFTGIVTTFAGTGIAGWKDGASDSAQFNSPSDLCVDDSGNVYISDFTNQRIRKISSTGIVTTIAGSGNDGFLDGVDSVSKFNYPRGICRDKSGNLYIGDSWNHRIRKIDSTGFVTTYAGGGTTIGVGSAGSLVDANDTSARFNTPTGLTIDQFGNIFVADAYNHRIRKIDTARAVTTILGTGATGGGGGGYINGSISIARFNVPTELFIDTNSNELYISDTFNHRIRKTNSAGDSVTTLAGNGTAAFINEFDTLASFNFPRGIVADYSSGLKIYVADYSNNSIRLLSSPNTGIFENNIIDDGIIVYPNPSTNNISVIVSKGDFTNFELYNASGICIAVYPTKNENHFQMDISDQPNGFYLLKFSNESGIYSFRKIVKY